MTSVGSGSGSGSDTTRNTSTNTNTNTNRTNNYIKKPVSLLLDPYEYFTVCLLRYPTIVPFTKQATNQHYNQNKPGYGYNNYGGYGYTNSSGIGARVAADAVGCFTRAMGVGDVLSIIEEWVSGNNYLKLYLQYIQHNYPLLVYNHNTNEFLHTDEMYIRGQTDGSNSGSGSGSGGARGRHTPSRTMGGSNSGSSGSTSHNSAMSSKALIVQSNREFFNHLACVYLIETAIVVRHSFAVAANAVVEQSSGSGDSGSVPSSLINSFTYGTLNIV